MVCVGRSFVRDLQAMANSSFLDVSCRWRACLNRKSRSRPSGSISSMSLSISHSRWSGTVRARSVHNGLVTSFDVSTTIVLVSAGRRSWWMICRRSQRVILRTCAFQFSKYLLFMVKEIPDEAIRMPFVYSERRVSTRSKNTCC